MSPPDLKQLPGLVATCVTTGSVEEAFMMHWSHLRSWCDRNGFHKIEWRNFGCTLVEQGRDEVAAHALKQGYEWVLQLDADAAPFADDLLVRLLSDAYVQLPDSDVVGAYCQLKGTNLPTIDTGTGTWEEHYPGEGIVQVMRTGGHCHLTKTRAYKRVAGPPWYRTRLAAVPTRTFAEMDNFMRQHMHGANPLADTPEWQEGLRIAATDKRWVGQKPSPVGEDSAFFDALLAAGGKAFVDTDVVVGHVTKDVILPHKLREQVDKRERMLGLACGVVG